MCSSDLQCRVTKKEWIALIDDALAHLGAEKGNTSFLNEGCEHLTGVDSVGARANQQQRMLRRFDHFNGSVYGMVAGQRSIKIAALNDRSIGVFTGNVFR